MGSEVELETRDAIMKEKEDQRYPSVLLLLLSLLLLLLLEEALSIHQTTK
jgi:hypothetical protein